MVIFENGKFNGHFSHLKKLPWQFLGISWAMANGHDTPALES